MIEISLTSNQEAFRPGDMIRGVVRWSEEKTASIEARLIWYTEGKGDRDAEIARSRELKTEKPTGEMPFEFKAPHRPHSFAGKLIALTWAIEAVVMPANDAQTKEIVIAPNAKEIQLTPVEE